MLSKNLSWLLRPEYVDRFIKNWAIQKWLVVVDLLLKTLDNCQLYYMCWRIGWHIIIWKMEILVIFVIGRKFVYCLNAFLMWKDNSGLLEDFRQNIRIGLNKRTTREAKSLAVQGNEMTKFLINTIKQDLKGSIINENLKSFLFYQIVNKINIKRIWKTSQFYDLSKDVEFAKGRLLCFHESQLINLKFSTAVWMKNFKHKFKGIKYSLFVLP